MSELASVTHEGVTVESYLETPAQLREQLGMEPASTLDETPTPEPVAADDAEEVADAKADKAEAKVEAAKPAGKPRNDPNARIAQAVAKQREAERKAADLERRAAELEARLAAPKAETLKPVVAAPEKFPSYEQHLATNPNASLEDWMDARDVWRDAKRDADAKARAATEQRLQAYTSYEQKLNERITAARVDDPDFLSRVDSRLLEAKPLSALSAAEREHSTFGNFLADQVLKSEHPKELLLHLSDETLIQRLATLPPDDVIRDLAKFEYGLTAAHSGPAQKAPPATSKAAPPIKPVVSAPPVDADAPPDDDASDDEWLQYERRREGRARRR